ncbi:hypothetical protein PG996_011883 [Apiospora saccharicola]|uniref:Wax synthase domain-containing protein n=1 Tax=Apiospora saccharicola TaxID=335842 RepID=A0ABR1UGB4_9PEZI
MSEPMTDPKGPGLKVIVAGLPRTGTMSMKAALEQLGYGPCHHLLEPACQITRLRKSAAILEMPSGIKRQQALRKLLDGYEVSLDIPGSACVEDLLALYPEAQVVLTTRQDGRAWLDSYASIFQPLTSLSFRLVGFWVPGAYNCARMVLGWNRVYAERFPGVQVPSVDMYERHSAHIRAITPPGRLLEIPVGSGWAPLCEFLDRPVPGTEFPRRNERNYLVNVNRLTYVCGVLIWGLIALWGPHLINKVLQNEFLTVACMIQTMLFTTLLFSHKLPAAPMTTTVETSVLFAVALLLYTSFVNGAIFSFTGNGVTNAVVFSCLGIQLLRAADILLLDPHPDPPSDPVDAFNALWNMREVGTPRQIAHLPQDNTYSKPGCGPSRPRFFLRTGVRIVVSYLVLEVITAMAPPPPPPDSSNGPDSLMEQAVARVLGAAGFWFLLSLYLSLIYNTLAFGQVFLFLSEPGDWPPLYGAISEAWSVRRFWGIRWHQTLRKTFGSHAMQLVKLSGLAPNGFIDRYATLTLVFAMSGLLHWVADRILRVPWAESGAMPFFLLQALGVVVEDCVIAVNRCLGLAKSGRVMGYVWVAGFLVFTTPLWMEPTSRYVRTGVDVMIPFRVLPFFGKGY